MADAALLGLAVQIVSAHVSNNEVPIGELPKLINDVHGALARVGQPEIAVKREPAIPVKQSVTASHIACLECGKRFSMLKRHLNTDHKLTPTEYRQKWDLPSSYPIVAPDYAKTRSTLAKKIGLGRKAEPATKKARRKLSR